MCGVFVFFLHCFPFVNFIFVYRYIAGASPRPREDSNAMMFLLLTSRPNEFLE